jgi:ferrochelatase
MRPGVLLLNFGGPRGPEELTPFLRNLFDDVLPFPTWVKRLAVPCIAASRAKRVGAHYQAIGWSPLVPGTDLQRQALQVALRPEIVPVRMGMLFTPPTVATALDALRAEGVDALIALALFPHFSQTTTGAAFARTRQALLDARLEIPVHYVGPFFGSDAYVEGVANTVRAGLRRLPGQGPVHLLFSPHGLPMSVVEQGDPYPDQVRRSARLVVDALRWTDPWHLAWQSRVGPSPWLAPSTLDVVKTLGRDGAERVLVVPISFVGEHIETLWELDVELARVAHASGIRDFGRAPALGTEPRFIDCLAECVRDGITHLARSSPRLVEKEPLA